jgi:ribosomal protein L11 methyltransferase
VDWLEIAVLAEDEAVDAVAEVLRAHGRGVAIDQPFLQPRLDEAPQRDPTRRPLVKTYIPEDAAAPAVQEEIARALWHLGQLRAVEPLAARRIREEDWANAWKPFFPVLHVGDRTVIVPAWRRYRRRREDELIVRLDPGLAFGTGTHPTTQLCLRWVERLVQPGSRVLDVGTGSGILAIAAARAGAASVLGLDIDPMAVDAARANVRLNRLSRRVRILEGSAEHVSSPLPYRGVGAPYSAVRERPAERSEAGRWVSSAHPNRRSSKPALTYDIVLANLTARVNAGIAPWLAAPLRPGGKVVASGILADSADTVADAFAAVGLRIGERGQEGDWVVLIAERTGAAG